MCALSDTAIITTKDLHGLLTNCSLRTAERYYSDIKKEYNIKVVMYGHFKEYFKLPS